MTFPYHSGYVLIIFIQILHNEMCQEVHQNCINFSFGQILAAKLTYPHMWNMIVTYF